MKHRFSPDLRAALRGLPSLDSYRNSTPVLTISGVALTVEDVIKAGIAGCQPILLSSGTGDGKSLLANDVAERWFGGRATVLRGDGGDSPVKAYLRTDFKALFGRRAENDEALIEASERIGYGLLFADELNRQLVTAMQGELLQVLDGQINYRGVTRTLGTSSGYFAVIAAMNTGPTYVAASDLDEALRQRFPIVLDLDHFSANVTDLARVGRPTRQRQSWLSEIEAVHAELAALEPLPTGLRLASAYIAHHLNRCSLLDRPKRTLVQRMPRLCEEKACPQMLLGCHWLDETPWRILLRLERVTLALQAVAISKAGSGSEGVVASIDGDCLDYLATLAVFGWPVSGVLARRGDDETSVFERASEIVGHVGESFERHSQAILDAIRLGRVDPKHLGSWAPVVSALQGTPRSATVRELPP